MEKRLRAVPQGSLSFGVEPIDRFLGGFSRGDIGLLYGSPSCYALADFMIVRALLQCETDVIYIDGGNCFNLYRISELVRQFGLPSKVALKRIHVSRSFTSHQLTTLIVRELSTELKRHPSRLVVVTDLLSIVRDEETEEVETKNMLNLAICRLRELAAEKAPPTILLPNSRITAKREETGLSTIIWPKADIVIKLQESRKRTRIIREKHPFGNGQIEINLRGLRAGMS